MSADMSKKAWFQPAITSVERMKGAASGAHNGLAKGPNAREYDYDGPGS